MSSFAGLVPDPGGMWEIRAPGRLGLRGSRLVIVLMSGTYPYHVHRENKIPGAKDQSCFGFADDLRIAKSLCLDAYKELVEMGVQP